MVCKANRSIEFSLIEFGVSRDRGGMLVTSVFRPQVVVLIEGKTVVQRSHAVRFRRQLRRGCGRDEGLSLMDRSEPSLVPEWLRSSGSATGSGGSSHHFASSQSEGPLSVLSPKNKSSKSVAKNDSLHSSLLDWNASSNSRSSSRNGSAKHEKNQYFRSYSGFTRSHRETKRDKLSIDDRWDAEYSDPLRSILTGRIEKDLLRRSQSMVSRKQGEVVPGKANVGSRGTGHSSHDKANGLVSVHSMEKMAFERDFPSLGSDDRPVTPDTVRVPSPGLGKSMQSLSIGNSSLIGGDGWTSALAEVPVGLEGNTLPSTLAHSTSINGLNMAEALVQAPLKSLSAHQPSVQNQKREELAVLQSMRLIPMTTSTPKNVINSSDKLKQKTPRYGDQMTASKNGHLLPSLQPASQLLRGANVKTDAAKTSHTGKLIVLKPGGDNGVSLALKETLSPTSSSTGNSVNGHASGKLSASSVATKNPKFSASSKISSAPFLNSGSMADKKLSSAHAQSRSDFFKLMRKKSMSKSAVDPLSVPVVSSDLEKSDEYKEVSYAPASPVKNEGETICNGEASGFGTSDNAAGIPEEEEAAFLRSLGWEESAGDDEGLTEEEINAFYQEYIKLKPAFKLCRGLQLKTSGQDEPQEACSTSDLTTSESSA
ncbi:hypothetical protein V2J09_008527 [Rumex salicifolius]